MCGTEAVDPSSIPGQVKPKTTKIGIHSFLAVLVFVFTVNIKNWYSQFSSKRVSVKPPPYVVDRRAGGSVTRRPKDTKTSLSSGQGKLVNKGVITIAIAVNSHQSDTNCWNE